MAKKDTVYIDIQTSDGGSMQRVAVSAKKLGLALDDVGVASKKTGQGAKNADRNLKGLSKQSSNSTKNFSKMAQGMTGTLVPAYAVLAANVFAITAAFAFLKKAADFRVMQESQVAFTGATGVGMKTLTANIQTASGAMLDFQSASESASIGIASGLGAGQIEELAAGAGNLSKILGRDVTDSFSRLVKGVTKAEPELLDELGITLRLTDAQTKYAASLGKSVKDLTIYEKKQAVFVEVQDQLETKYNAVAAATNVQANSIARLGVAFDGIMKVVKEYTAIIAEPVAEFFTKNIMSMTAALALLAIPIMRSIIPGLDSWAAKSKESAQAAKDSYKEASDELAKLSEKQADIKSGKAIADTIDKPSKGIQAGFGPGKMKAKNAAALLRQAVRTNKKLKHLDDKQLAAYRIHLKAQVRSHYTTMEQIHLQYLDLSRKLEVQNKKMVARWELAMAVMKGATAKFTRGVDLLFKGMGLIGVALMIKDLGKEFLIYLGYFKEHQGIKAHLNLIDELTNKSKDLVKEYSKFEEINRTMRQNARKKKKPEDTLEILGREGKMVESVGTAILKNLNLRKEEADLRAKMLKNNPRLIADEKLKLALLKEGLRGEGAPGATFAPNRAGDELKAKYGDDSKGLLAATQAYAGLNGQLERYQAMSSALAEAAGPLAEKNAALGVETKLAAEQMLEYLSSLDPGALNTLQKAYIPLLEKIVTMGGLVDTDKKKFADLTEQMGALGGEAIGTKQALDSLNTAYDAMIAGITTYKTKHTEMISNFNKELKVLKSLKTIERNSPENQKKITKITAQVKHLVRLRELEIGFANKKLRIDLAAAKISRGATKYQMDEIKRSTKIAQNLNSIAKIKADITESSAEGLTVDQDRIDQLEIQKELLVEQNKELERQRDLGAAVMDAMMQSIETNIQKAIADIMKGTETSFKRLVGTFATSVVHAMIDAFAQNITEKIMNMFSMKTQAQKTKEAVTAGVEEGAKTHAKEIEDALARGTTAFAKALDDAAANFADAIREACHTCSCSGASMAPTSTAAADAVIVATDTKPGPPTGPSTDRRDEPTGQGDGTFGGDQVPSITTPESALERNARLEQAFLEELLAREAHAEALREARPSQLGKEAHESWMREQEGEGPSITVPKLESGEHKKLKVPSSKEFTNDLSTVFEENSGGSGTGLVGTMTSAFSGFGGDLGGIFSSLLGSLGGGGGGAGGLMSLFGFANGGVVQGGFRQYAKGGIATKPHIGLIGEGKMNEAVVPLPDGKSIPVSMPRNAGGGVQTNNVGITVNIDNQGNASTSSDNDGEGASKLGETLAAMVQEELINQKRNGGILSPFGAT